MAIPKATEAPDAEDADLMQALQAGREEALGMLMERWELPLKAFLIRLGVRAGDVEDIAQESFVRLYASRARFRPGSPFKPWLLTIAGNCARNRNRWWRRRRETSWDESAGPDLAADGSNPAQGAEASQMHELVRALVASLPQDWKDAINCVDLEGLSQSEAAGVLGCSAKAVELRLRRARGRLREQLERLREGFARSASSAGRTAD